jgi:hypothetical protein
MLVRDITDWPPKWSARQTAQSAVGEVGTLQSVKRSVLGHFLILGVVHGGVEYLGLLQLGRELAEKLYPLFRANIGKSLAEIGSLEIPP